MFRKLFLGLFLIVGLGVAVDLGRFVGWATIAAASPSPMVADQVGQVVTAADPALSPFLFTSSGGAVDDGDSVTISTLVDGQRATWCRIVPTNDGDATDHTVGVNEADPALLMIDGETVIDLTNIPHSSYRIASLILTSGANGTVFYVICHL